ncbi:hypothetical protein [Agromyces bauzanensis]|uniref:Uncharacterized protein n=1 Tax=Agromyces bauzanensis TaxID=1308924 RepID=A0A917PN74_9MICO|nr:hypothetical protein [Agromyces bauzanensis]GGJ84687.1 hypothetical protein GCM10011372_23740 [Agromyces bauzanensis]
MTRPSAARLAERATHSLAELRSWPRSRGWIVAGAAAGAAALLVTTGGLVTSASSAPWWAWPVIAAGALLFGLVVATFRGAPAGAEPVVCDLRWPVLGFVGLSLATEQVSAVPMIDPLVRPAFALAALALLVHGLIDRMSRERRMIAERRRLEAGGESIEGLTCTTCRPLFPARRSAAAATTTTPGDDLTHL